MTHVAEWLEEFRSWMSPYMAGVIRVADGLPVGPHLDVPCHNRFDHLHVSASVSGPLPSMPPAWWDKNLGSICHHRVQVVSLRPVDLGGMLYFYPPASQSLYPQRRRPCWIFLAVQIPTWVPIRNLFLVEPAWVNTHEFGLWIPYTKDRELS